MSQPHRKYQHLFVVVRLNKRFQATEDFDGSEDAVMLTKAFFEQEDAEREASRLNGLNEEFWHYFVCAARLVDSDEHPVRATDLRERNGGRDERR